MASPNYNWQWSAEHNRWYRQEYINGKWDTIYAHQRSDSLFSNHSGYSTITPSNPIQQLPAPTPVEAPPVPQVHPPPPQLSYPPLQVHPQVYTPSTYHNQHGNSLWVPYSYPNPQLSSPHPTVPASSQLQVPSNNPYSGRRRGLTLEGRYVPGAQHFEDLDSTFYVRNKDFFKEGKVFAVLFTEPCGSTVTDYNTSISTVRFGQYVHSQIRRFIVVRTMREFCYACPIFTYKGQGTLKQGVRPEEHAIAYSWSREPELLEGEPELRLKPICIVGAQGTYPLQKASRIYFGIHHPIQYNVKVKNLGDVYPPQIQTLRGYWKMVNREPTNQAIEVTAAGPAEDDGDDDDDDDDNHAVEDEED